MKKIIILIVLSFILSSCAQQEKKTASDFGYKHTLRIKSYDVAKKWDIVPVAIKIEPAMEPGDILILKYRENEVAKVFAKGDLKIDSLRFRIRASGTGKIVVFLHKPDGDQSVWSKNLIVSKYGNIPKENTQKLSYRKRVKNGAADIIIKNDSAENEFVKKVSFKFANGEAIICGSKYLSPNPYLYVKPVKLIGKPAVKIELANYKNNKCVP